MAAEQPSNPTLTGSDALAGESLRGAVVSAAESYVDALYSAKLARAMSWRDDADGVIKAQMLSVQASRALVKAVGDLRDAAKSKAEVMP